jgi:hypothetical protein
MMDGEWRNRVTRCAISLFNPYSILVTCNSQVSISDDFVILGTDQKNADSGYNCTELPEKRQRHQRTFDFSPRTFQIFTVRIRILTVGILFSPGVFEFSPGETVGLFRRNIFLPGSKPA